MSSIESPFSRCNIFFHKSNHSLIYSQFYCYFMDLWKNIIHTWVYFSRKISRIHQIYRKQGFVKNLFTRSIFCCAAFYLYVSEISYYLLLNLLVNAITEVTFNKWCWCKYCQKAMFSKRTALKTKKQNESKIVVLDWKYIFLQHLDISLMW